ncbi:MAG: hypothetical protein DRP64_03980 [Verrucomicrobia bacterium]|nr:MAG: hypothetical protein DRP64_03980 [Verrucomicrobiota bacterium]
MNIYIIANLIVLLSIHIVFAEPGGLYTLTGKEKSLEEIISTDMETFPDLYKGESLKFYLGKFKNENNLGHRKLAPGDQLIFPETKASIKAKKTAQRQHLIGRWRYGQDDNPKVWLITEYKADGTFTIGNGEKPTYSGTWEIKDEYLHDEIKVNHFRKLFPGEQITSKKKIVLISGTELKTQVKGTESRHW